MGSWGFIDRGSRLVVRGPRCYARTFPRTANREPRTTSSYIEKNLLDMHDVFQVEQPAQHHLDGQRHHDQKEKCADVVARRSHLQIEAPEWSVRQQRRQAQIA